MLDRSSLFVSALAGLFATGPVAHCLAKSPAAAAVGLVSFMADDGGGKKDTAKNDAAKNDAAKNDAAKNDDDREDQKGDDHDDDHHAKKPPKEIEQPVPMDMIPAPVLDAVKKEVPDGKITEAELEAKKGKIMYSFDVKTPDAAYEVKITVDGKFYSKKVDDDGDDDKEGK